MSKIARSQMAFDFSLPQEVEQVQPQLYLSPNPHFGDLVSLETSVKKVEQPYSSNISAGKNTYVYDAHTYHTKVPPQGIQLLIEHYTEPGDVVLDPFCGSGMTGVAAAQAGRKALLSDLSPAAVFIAYNLNTPIEAGCYLRSVDALLISGADLEKQLYGTHCRYCNKLVPMLYMVWSYGFLCKECGKEFILWDVARDEQPRVRDSKIKTEFECPHCNRWLKKRELKRTQRYPVAVGYKCCQKGPKELTAPLDDFDKGKLMQIDAIGVPPELWHPTAPFQPGVNTKQPIAAGIDSIDKAYTTRALTVMAYLWDQAINHAEKDIKNKLLFTLTSLYQRVTLFSEFRFWGGSGNTANYNVPAIINEQNVFRAFSRKADTIGWYFRSADQHRPPFEVSTQSACHLPQLPDRSVDYIFTDPPFGANINYSEMNFLWESWLGVYTNTEEEAIINRVQAKDTPEYQSLLTKAFSELRRVLKDGGWLTIVFHNSSAQVWGALQEAIRNAGFTIQGTQTFDKEHGTFKQHVSDNAVGYDLVLHCRKSETAQPALQDDLVNTLSQVQAFIRDSVQCEPEKYITHYLHVRRGDEFNYRRLYAGWLAASISKAKINLSFEDFRALVNQILPGSRHIS